MDAVREPIIIPTNWYRLVVKERKGKNAETIAAKLKGIEKYIIFVYLDEWCFEVRFFGAAVPEIAKIAQHGLDGTEHLEFFAGKDMITEGDASTVLLLLMEMAKRGGYIDE